jgi:hypothetical protein
MRRVGLVLKGIMMVMGEEQGQQMDKICSFRSGGANGMSTDAGIVTGGPESPPTSSNRSEEGTAASPQESTQDCPFRQTICVILNYLK